MNIYQCSISVRFNDSRREDTTLSVQIQIATNSINRETLTVNRARQNELLTNSLKSIEYYADNIPVVSLNEDTIINQPKKKLTIYDLNRLIFPFDPIRDWVERKIKEINEKYAWAEEL